jgi:uncharacterized protein (DUF2236 family)
MARLLTAPAEQLGWPLPSPAAHPPGPAEPQVVLLDDELRRQLLRAFTEDDRLHVEELSRLLRLVQVGNRPVLRSHPTASAAIGVNAGLLPCCCPGCAARHSQQISTFRAI